MKPLNNIILKIATYVAIIVLLIISIQQCSKKKDLAKGLAKEITLKNKALADYIELTKAKMRVDTFYRYADTLYVESHIVKKEVDTLYIKDGVVYSLFKDSFKSDDLALTTYIRGAYVDSVSYEYSVRERVIIQNTITQVHDTIPQATRRHLYIMGDIGLPSYSVGLYLQGKKRWGYTLRYTWYGDKRSLSAGTIFRLY